VLAALALLPGAALAKQTVAALAFGGPGATAIRTSILRPLQKRYDILHGSQLLDACDALGISMTRGPNLARAAKHIGAVAVIGGAVTRGALSLAVYSGRTGQPLITGRVPARGGKLNTAGLRKALTIIVEGLRKAPKSVGRPHRPVAAPTPAPTPTPAPAPAGGDLTFEPDPVESSGGGSGSSAVTLSPDSGQAEDPSYETPLGGPEENPLASKGPAPVEQTAQPQGEVKKTPDSFGAPRAEATIGLGTWMRRLSINQPDPRNPAPKYDSGAAFAISLGFKVRPIAFLSDGLAANFYSRLRYQTMLGLESASQDGTFSTSLWELLWEVVGFDWNVMSKPTSPHLELGIGFGLMSFTIDWPEATTKRQMPDASYSWFLASVGAYMPMPFVSFLGAHLRLDYRVVSGTGEIEDETEWYGPSSTGGINLLVGIDGNYKGIVARLEYTYTRYFYNFSEAEARLTACGNQVTCTQKTAGGALDVLHGFIFSVGYSL